MTGEKGAPGPMKKSKKSKKSFVSRCIAKVRRIRPDLNVPTVVDACRALAKGHKKRGRK